MRRKTISVHAGFVCDPATRAVSPPIYQNVAYAFDSADHAAALFDLEAPGFRYSRIANPIVEILERRVAALAGRPPSPLTFAATGGLEAAGLDQALAAAAAQAGPRAR